MIFGFLALVRIIRSTYIVVNIRSHVSVFVLAFLFLYDLATNGKTSQWQWGDVLTSRVYNPPWAINFVFAPVRGSMLSSSSAKTVPAYVRI